MRILHVANSEKRYRGLRYYSFPSKIQNGLIRNGHCVELFCDRDTARAASLFKSRKLGVKQANAALVETARNFAPELIFVSHADIITEQTLLEIRTVFPATPIAQYNVDPLFMKEPVEKMLRKHNAVDVNFMTTAGRALERVAPPRGFAAYLPNPADASIESERAFETSRAKYDVMFAFGDMAEEPDRYDITQAITHTMPDVRLGVFESKKGNGLFGAEYVRALGMARAGLNISRGKLLGRDISAAEIYLYSSDRLSHYMGNGLLTFTHEKFALQELFSAHELITYSSCEDLVDKLGYYLHKDSELRKCAQAGWRKYHTHYNERLVTRYMVETVLDLPFSCAYAWPTERIHAPPLAAGHR